MVAKVKNRRHSVKEEAFLSKKLVMVSIRKFWIIVLISNWIEYWSNFESIRNFEYLHSTNSYFININFISMHTRLDSLCLICFFFQLFAVKLTVFMRLAKTRASESVNDFLINCYLVNSFPPRTPWPHLSYGLVRSKREYYHNCSLVVFLCSFL